jgi:hypothetical protein
MPAARRGPRALLIVVGVVALAAIAGVSGYLLRANNPDKPSTIGSPAPDAALIGLSDAVVANAPVAIDSASSVVDAPVQPLTAEQEHAFGAVLEASKKKLDACYARTGVKKGGDVQISVDADSNGRAMNVSFENLAPEAETCVRAVLADLAFPKTPTGFSHSYWQRIDAPKPKKQPEAGDASGSGSGGGTDPIGDNTLGVDGKSTAPPPNVQRYHAQVARTLQSARGRLNPCRKGNEVNIGVILTLKDDGSLQRIEVLNAAVETQRCIGQELARVTFPAPPPGVSRQIRVPFRFTAVPRPQPNAPAPPPPPMNAPEPNVPAPTTPPPNPPKKAS